MHTRDIIILVIFIILAILLFCMYVGEHKKWCEFVEREMVGRDDDTIPDRLQRIENANNNTNAEVIWKKTLSISIVISLLIFYLVLQRSPNIFELLAAIFVVFFLWYAIQNWENYHKKGYLRSFVRGNISKVRQQLGLAAETNVVCI